MATLNSYFSIASNDLLYAKNGLEFCGKIGNYNQVVVGCVQAVEKFFKSVIEIDSDLTGSDFMSLLHSHNLRTLRNQIINKYELNVSSLECKWLGDFYFDTRYPGDNFIITNEQDALDSIRIAETVQADIESILEEIEKKRKQSLETLNKLKAF